MDCPSDHLNSTSADQAVLSSFSQSAIIKVIFLSILLLLIFCSNLLLLLKAAPEKRKRTACDRLIKTLCLVGVLNGVLNLLPYLVTALAGRWIFGDTMCQFRGLFGAVMVDSWRWILAITAFERYVKLLVPYEHGSYFSELNTKILTAGAVLLLVVIYMGPVYGWGEYSTLRGTLDVTLTIHHNNAQLSKDRLQLAMLYLHTLTSSPDPVIENLTSYLEDVRQVALRTPYPTEDGIMLPMRAFTSEALNCLWFEYQNGTLLRTLQSLLVSNSSAELPGLSEFQVNVSIEKEDYLLYKNAHMPLQESAMCSLDYSVGDQQHVYAFIGLTWLISLLTPLGIVLYCYSSLAWAGVHRTCMVALEGKTREDALWMWVFFCTSLTSLAFGMASDIMSLLAGQGVYISANVHFTLTTLVYASPCLLGLYYLILAQLLNIQCKEGFCTCCYQCCSHVEQEVFALSEIQRLMSISDGTSPRSSIQSTLSPFWMVAHGSISNTALCNETTVETCV